MHTVMMRKAGYKVEFRSHGRWHGRTVYEDGDGREYVRNPWGDDRSMFPLEDLCRALPTRKVMSDDKLGYLVSLFSRFYRELCESGDADPDFGWYLERGNALVDGCDPQLTAFNIHRRDVLGSDREVVAYVKACEYVGWL